MSIKVENLESLDDLIEHFIENLLIIINNVIKNARSKIFLKISWIGQVGLVIETKGKEIVVDRITSTVMKKSSGKNAKNSAFLMQNSSSLQTI